MVDRVRELAHERRKRRRRSRRRGAAVSFGRWLVDRGLVRGDLADYQWDDVVELVDRWMGEAE